jgi:tetratricopeptide (TPR) repeat protein
VTTRDSGDEGVDARAPARGEAAQDDAAAQGERAYDLFQTGRRFLAERHPAQAAMFLERALLLAPDKNSIREALGRSYYALGRYGRAAQDFEELLRRAPTNDYAHFAMARCLLKLEDVAGALRAARLAVAMAPDNADYKRALDDCLAEG